MKTKMLLGVWGYYSRSLRHGAIRIEEAEMKSLPHIPPLSPTYIGHFDYLPFLLFDDILIDKKSYENIINWRKRDLGFPSIKKNAIEILKYLESIGHLSLVNYADLLKPYEKAIMEQVNIDLYDRKIYYSFKESLALWHQFVRQYEGNFFQEAHISSLRRLADDFLTNFEVNIKFEKYLDIRPIPALLSSYLFDINSTLILSNILKAGFYDWNDYYPFYKYKLSRAGQIDQEEKKKIERSGEIFEVFVPEFSIETPNQLSRLIEDSRIEDLRMFVSESVTKKIEIDQEFQISVQKRVLDIEEKIRDYSRIISYATAPIGVFTDLATHLPLIGTIIQESIKKILTDRMAKKERKPFNWFYLLRDVSRHFSKQDVLSSLSNI